jgi:hypothetical protein
MYIGERLSQNYMIVLSYKWNNIYGLRDSGDDGS